jgi:SAM-dependent methyltransferase
MQWLEDVRESAKLELLDRARSFVKGTREYAAREVNARIYFRTHLGPKKLRIGTGHPLDGWLEAGLDPIKRFPFEDESFDAIFSEHVLEELEHQQGCFMLRECWRVLKPGGVIRIVTTDLESLIALYRPKRTAIQDRFIRTITDQHLYGLGKYEPVFVVNLALGRTEFTYDAALLEEVLRESAFVDIEKMILGESNREIFRGVDAIEDRELDGYASMAFEARKPT